MRRSIAVRGNLRYRELGIGNDIIGYKRAPEPVRGRILILAVNGGSGRELHCI